MRFTSRVQNYSLTDAVEVFCLLFPHICLLVMHLSCLYKISKPRQLSDFYCLVILHIYVIKALHLIYSVQRMRSVNVDIVIMLKTTLISYPLYVPYATVVLYGFQVVTLHPVWYPGKYLITFDYKKSRISNKNSRPIKMRQWRTL